MQILADLLSTIPATNSVAMSRTQWYVDGLLKLVDSLGELEVPAIQLVGMPGLNGIPRVGRKAVLVMCADYGVWEEGAVISPEEVTAIQAENMTRGTTGVCVLTTQTGANVHIVDVGIDIAEPIPRLINIRVARDSGNIASAPAMSRRQAEKLLLDVTCYTRELVKNSVTLFGVGELGMASTAPVAAIVSTIAGRDPKEVVGVDADLPTGKLANKIDAVCRAITLNQSSPQDGVDILAKVGGFDLVRIAGVVLGAASYGLPVLLDGFLSYTVALVACQISPIIRPYLIPSHLSAEKGARIALSHLGLEPYLNMDMRLDEGSGAALAMFIIEVAYAICNNTGELVAGNIVLPGNTTSDLNS